MALLSTSSSSQGAPVPFSGGLSGVVVGESNLCATSAQGMVCGHAGCFRQGCCNGLRFNYRELRTEIPTKKGWRLPRVGRTQPRRFECRRFRASLESGYQRQGRRSSRQLSLSNRPRISGRASRVLQLYYTGALFARAALLLAVRHPRLCLCGSVGAWRYAPLRCKTPENTTINVLNEAASRGGFAAEAQKKA